MVDRSAASSISKCAPGIRLTNVRASGSIGVALSCVRPTISVRAPTEGRVPKGAVCQRILRSYISIRHRLSDELQFLGIDSFLDFLCVRHLLCGVADEQRRSADEDDYPT